MSPPPGPYSGTSTLALVARASAFMFGVVYGNLKLKYLKITGYTFLHPFNFSAVFSSSEGLALTSTKA
ncbi:uncharacterized protein [Coffea arabica]|uniref:Uncharacterized protein n=1 Tax=Coffea arabica TaxID=13443 RepID=A0A6P6TB15_COFAR|nr:uncharacterized protein LOC113699284 isoform X2 [Coffea arabica]